MNKLSSSSHNVLMSILIYIIQDFRITTHIRALSKALRQNINPYSRAVLSERRETVRLIIY